MPVISVYNLKPYFQKILHPVLIWLVKKKITANMVTFAAIIGSTAVGLLPVYVVNNRWVLVVLPLWLLIRMALNAIDGMLAREFNMVSNKGFYFNEIGDVVSDAVLYLPLAFFAHDILFVISIFCLGAMLTEFCGVLPKALGFSRRYEGPMGKSDRALWVGLILILTAFWPGMVKWWGFFFTAMVLLEIVTCFKRIRYGLKEA